MGVTFGHFWVGLVGGIAVGFVLHSTSIHAGAIPAPTAFSGALTVFAAWAIQRAIKRQGSVDEVATSVVGRAFERIETRAVGCLDCVTGRKEERELLNRDLRVLSNEIHVLGQIIAALEMDDATHSAIAGAFFTFKAALTGSQKPDLSAASVPLRTLRLLCLSQQWQISERVVSAPVNIRMAIAKLNSETTTQVSAAKR